MTVAFSTAALALAIFAVLSLFATGATECGSAAGTCNGGTNLSLDGSLTVNDEGEAVDVRIETDTNENILDTDGTNNRIAFGADASSQTELFTVAGAATFTGELNLGAAPGPGSANQLLASQGAGSAPEWTTINESATYLVKSSDTTTVSDATLSDDPHLTFTGDANDTYAVWGVVIFTENISTTGHFAKIRLGPPSGDTELSSCSPWGSSTNVQSCFVGDETIAATCNASTSLGACQFAGMVDISSTGGTVALEWAQNSSQTTTLRLKANSWLAYKKIIDN